MPRAGAGQPARASRPAPVAFVQPTRSGPIIVVGSQVETDGTVGDAVDLPGPDYEIPGDLGSQRGSTLFHSFLRFGVPEDGSATFTADGLDPGNPVDLVVSRVTGGEISTIDGHGVFSRWPGVRSMAIAMPP